LKTRALRVNIAIYQQKTLFLSTFFCYFYKDNRQKLVVIGYKLVVSGYF